MSTPIFLQVHLLVQDREAGMNDPKIESDQSIAVRRHNALDVVELINLSGMVGRVGVGVLEEEFVSTDFAKGTKVIKTFALDCIVQAEI